MPIFRIEEVMLNYAEAMCELGEFDQTVANLTINKLRPRANVAPMIVTNIDASFDPKRDKGNSDYSGDREGSYDYARWVRDENGELVRLGTANDDPLKWSKGSSMIYFMNFQAMVQWQRQFGDHNVDAFVNYMGEDRLGKDSSAAWLLPYTRIQLGGHVKYGYANRYFAQFDFTYAGNEQHAQGEPVSFLPHRIGGVGGFQREFPPRCGMAQPAEVPCIVRCSGI